MRPRAGLSQSVGTSQVLSGDDSPMDSGVSPCLVLPCLFFILDYLYQDVCIADIFVRRERVFLWNRELTAHYKIFGFP